MAQTTQRQDQAGQPSEGDRKASGQIPETPVLAPNVELSGEMQESGFEQGQWLLQRDGQFVQVTELLYRVAAQIDGERTIDQIAEAVSEATGRGVSAENIRQLIDTKLVPLGIVVGPDGSVPQTASAAEGGAVRSPLKINMRTTVVRPNIINPITAVLQPLYWPPVLIAVLLVAFALQGWLFFIHGIARSVHQALYQPDLMLVLLGFIIVSAAFHELGHATALRYGGGNVRGMGVGLYLVYPAFYTDVTDNYRLARWARIRTDLGGFYFNLIFGLAVMGVYFATGLEFLLIVVLLVDLDIIHQMLPFVRLDGYWALADITGLPDFFSQILPFLRSVLPIPGGKGRKLPNLKGWVKAVFATYILVTVPLLAFLFFLMAFSVPRILGTAWDSALKQAHILTHALGHGDILGLIIAGLQILLLALPVFGLLLILFNVARGAVRLLWNWSKPTPARRAAGSMVAVAAAALIVFLWAPHIPLGQGGPGPLYAETSFQPIQSNEHGTIGDTVGAVTYLGGTMHGPKGPGSRPTRRGGTPTALPAVAGTRTARHHGTATPGTPGTPAAPGARSTPSSSNGGTGPTHASRTQTPAPTGTPSSRTTPSPRNAPTATPKPAPTVAAAATSRPVATTRPARTAAPAPTATAAPVSTTVPQATRP